MAAKKPEGKSNLVQTDQEPITSLLGNMCLGDDADQRTDESGHAAGQLTGHDLRLALKAAMHDLERNPTSDVIKTEVKRLLNDLRRMTRNNSQRHIALLTKLKHFDSCLALAIRNMSALQDDARRVKVTTDEDEGPWPNDVIDDLIVSKPQLKRITVKEYTSISKQASKQFPTLLHGYAKLDDQSSFDDFMLVLTSIHRHHKSLQELQAQLASKHPVATGSKKQAKTKQAKPRQVNNRPDLPLDLTVTPKRAKRADLNNLAFASATQDGSNNSIDLHSASQQVSGTAGVQKISIAGGSRYGRELAADSDEDYYDDESTDTASIVTESSEAGTGAEDNSDVATTVGSIPINGTSPQVTGGGGRVATTSDAAATSRVINRNNLAPSATTGNGSQQDNARANSRPIIRAPVLHMPAAPLFIPPPPPLPPPLLPSHDEVILLSDDEVFGEEAQWDHTDYLPIFDADPDDDDEDFGWSHHSVM